MSLCSKYNMLKKLYYALYIRVVIKHFNVLLIFFFSYMMHVTRYRKRAVMTSCGHNLTNTPWVTMNRGMMVKNVLEHFLGERKTSLTWSHVLIMPWVLYWSPIWKGSQWKLLAISGRWISGGGGGLRRGEWKYFLE